MAFFPLWGYSLRSHPSQLSLLAMKYSFTLAFPSIPNTQNDLGLLQDFGGQPSTEPVDRQSNGRQHCNLYFCTYSETADMILNQMLHSTARADSLTVSSTQEPMGNI